MFFSPICPAAAAEREKKWTYRTKTKQQKKMPTNKYECAHTNTIKSMKRTDGRTVGWLAGLGRLTNSLLLINSELKRLLLCWFVIVLIPSFTQFRAHSHSKQKKRTGMNTVCCWWYSLKWLRRFAYSFIPSDSGIFLFALSRYASFSLLTILHENALCPMQLTLMRWCDFVFHSSYVCECMCLLCLLRSMFFFLFFPFFG